MRKTSKPFLILFALILLVMSLPLATSERLRGLVTRIFSPLWEVLSPLQVQGKQTRVNEVVYKNTYDDPPHIESAFADGIPARVIFRTPSTWNSSLWINIGTDANEPYSQPILAKNSPVLVGDSIVGVVDYVGKYQSRVRLITDLGLVPSVRVARGYKQNRVFVENLSDLISYANSHSELFENSQEKHVLENALRNIQQKLLEKKHTWYLAKGEIYGQSRPLWRKNGHILRGSGFNYDYEDEYGPARDLRTGEPMGVKKDLKAMPLVKVHDLLVTTGMDGVFPPGLKVALVTKVHLLHEGDFAFDLEARPTVGNLEDLTWVYVIAPLGYDEKDQPSIR